MSRYKSTFKKVHGIHWRLVQNNHLPSGEETHGKTAANVGINLRRFREERNLTIRSLAEISGLSINTLSLIENGKSSPSVKSLRMLASALNVHIASFFDSPTKKNQIVYVRAEERPVAKIPHGLLEDMGASASMNKIEPYIVTLDAFAGSKAHDVVHTGYEFVFCLQGRIAYTIQENTYLLKEGDSILFEAYLPHCWQNLSSSASKCLLILFPSDERDSPTELHFSNE